MTAQAPERPVSPYRSQAGPGKAGFAQLLHAEWTKFRTVRGWLAGLLVAVLLTVGLGVLVAAGGAQAVCQAAGGGPVRSGAACGKPANPIGPGGEPVADQFYFVHQPLAGNGSLTVRIMSLTGLLPASLGSNPDKPGLVPWAKAGIIINGTDNGSAYAAMMVTGGNGVRMQWNYTGDTPGLPGAVSAASPRWLRLTRDGDTITGYDSADGTHWTRVGAVTLTGLPATVQAGLFVASPTGMAFAPSFGEGGISDGPSLATAVFDQVSTSGAWPSGAWAGESLGGGPQGLGYHQTAGRFTVTGSGDIAPILAGPLGDVYGPDGTVLADYLVGTFAGLVAAAVVAAMYMSSEYRRGLIRTTLAASPARARVLAAKTVVIGAAAFVAGLAAAGGTVAFATWYAHSHGRVVFPEPWPTELRIIAGTAALIAVAAVLALALATILRRSVAVVTIMIVAIVLPYLLTVTSVLPAGAAEWVLRLSPAAAFALQQAAPAYHQVQAAYAPGVGYYPLAPWAGFAVLCAWTALALGAAAYLLKRRDA